jgi:hypothetical protein
VRDIAYAVVGIVRRIHDEGSQQRAIFERLDARVTAAVPLARQSFYPETPPQADDMIPIQLRPRAR